MKSTKSKERIIQAAVTLFARKGYAETGLRELAASADVNLAMINYFFGSKKELLKEILDVFFSGFLDIARKKLTGPGDWHRKVRCFIRRTIDYFDSHRDYLLVTITELSHDDPEIVDHKANWAKKMVDIIEKEICLPLAKETGREIPPTCIGPMLVSFMSSRFLFAQVMERVNPEAVEKTDLQAYAEMVINVFYRDLPALTGKKKSINLIIVMKNKMSTEKKRIESLFTSQTRLIIKFRIPILLIVLALSFALASQIRYLNIDTSNEGLLHPDDHILLTYNEFRDQFGRDDLLVLAIKSDSIFSLPFLEKLKKLHEQLEERVPHISEINSLVNGRDTRGEGDTLLVMTCWPISHKMSKIWPHLKSG